MELLLDWHAELALHLHVGNELSRYFLKDLFSEISPLHSLIEDNELDDITLAGLTSRVPKTTTIPIQLFHGTEVSIANTDNDDWARHVRQIIDQVFSLGHVMNVTICHYNDQMVQPIIF